MAYNTLLRHATGPETTSATPVIIPLGSTEQHGPHLPIDTDSYLAESMAIAVGERLGAMVAPTVSYGCRSQPVSGGGETFAGTFSLSGNTYVSLIADLVSALGRSGHREIVLLNGHFENSAFAIEAATVAVERGADVRVVLINWWEVLPLQEMEKIFDGEFPGWEAEHAGVVETSLMLHIDRSRVRTELIGNHIASVSPPPYTVIPEQPGHVDRSGVLRTAHGSSAEIGERVFEASVQNMTAHLAVEFGLEEITL